MNEKLESGILKAILKGHNRMCGIIFSLPREYYLSDISQMVWRLVDRGWLRFSMDREFELTSKGERQMTKTTKTTSNVRSDAARKAHETRKANADKRSNAAKKAWATRRRGATVVPTTSRSEAARKAHATRRRNAANENTTQTSIVANTDRSAAARKAWATRRARAIEEKRSEAARKAWRTRKMNETIRRTFKK